MNEASARKYVAEFIGTFFLVFTIGVSVREPGVVAPLAIGAVLMVMVYAGGHISGAHYNPAISLAIFLRGRLAAADLVPYWIAQVAGALAAGATADYVLNGRAIARLSFSGRAVGVALVVEFLFTFALAYVVLNVATSKDHPDNSFYGLAIGFTVTAGAFTVGGITGAAFNPAVALGASLMGLFAWKSIWIYLLATLAAAIVAAGAFRFLNPDDK